MPMKFQFLVRFTKQGKAKFLSHRELLNLFEQTIRRSALPVVFSEGFNPRPRISFPTALPLGIVSDDEIMYFQASEWISHPEIIKRINQVSIDGVMVSSIEPLRKNAIALMSVEYQVIPLAEESSCEICRISQDIIDEWMLSTERLVRRDYHNKTSKVINMRPYIRKIELRNGNLFIGVNIVNEGTVRPDEVMKSLGISGDIKGGFFEIRKVQTLI